ncbi:uncharacterized protein N0V89_004481 [Didymosphaeria variabile]|uniref:O-methyltransferase C-terminal domain-containing protein n=1 Tax=Didymosphaeria variabile TaxID=1932322 RepID=A0A9W8XS91_9PLEO|nr:uncharacterized protein N0V89_004481 [Didymosphaeria variabile]KAJ4356448.1 hypothetical protein N0V89_004481 [Didymosphaeria variabile]
MASRAGQLVETISQRVLEIEDFLKTQGVPNLSIEQDIPLNFQGNPNFASPKDAALLACKELSTLLGGSFHAITNQTASEFANTQAICRFKIPSSFPPDREQATYDQLAANSGLAEPEVRRLVRSTLSSYIFSEKEKGVVTRTAASRMLANNPLMVQWVEMTATEIMPATLKIADAIEKWPESGEPNQTGYNIANSTENSAFAHMAKFPGRPEQFAKAMSLFSMGPGYSPKWLLENYPWDSLRNGTLVDVGGSKGEYSITIAQKYPQIKVIVQDLPDVVDRAKSSTPADSADRITFMAHDFFTEQPIKGADVYLMRWILHDWSDVYAIRILRALIPALKKEAKIVLHEYIVPEPGETLTLQDRTLRIFDTAVRALTNGKEREVIDWKALFAEADSRFHVLSIEKPTGSSLGIIVVQWEG